MTVERADPAHSAEHGVFEPPYQRLADVRTARANMRHAVVTQARPASRRAPRAAVVDWLRGFVRKYGWRAYALPILTIVTIAALMTTTTPVAPKGLTPLVAGSAAPAADLPPAAEARISLKPDAKGTNFSETVRKSAALPAGAAYTKSGTGTFRVLKGTTAKVGAGRLFRYTIDVENGISGVDLDVFESMVDSVLGDTRSWSGHGVRLQRVDSGNADFHVSLTSAMTVRKFCGYDIRVETSCYTQAGSGGAVDRNRVVFNVARWMRGSMAYIGDLNAYRIYMINHENGHALGHNHAHQCLPGGLAPVMMQQTFGLRSANDDSLCQANPWPYPVGVAGAPGAEQGDTPQNTEYGRD